jgi:uncharacterized membrane protein
MTPEERSLLQRTYHLVEENNTILRGIRRANRWGVAIKVFYWSVIIGVTLGAFYFVQPYVESMLNLVDQAQESIKTINGNISQVEGALNILKK